MTLAMNGKSRRRRIALSVAALLAIVLGVTAGVAGLRGDSATAEGGDPTQVNISSFFCIEGGVVVHFVAPHGEDGTGGTLTVNYSVGGEFHVATAPESDANSSGNVQWDVTLVGSGPFEVDSASSGSFSWGGNGPGSFTCGETGSATPTATETETETATPTETETTTTTPTETTTATPTETETTTATPTETETSTATPTVTSTESPSEISGTITIVKVVNGAANGAVFPFSSNVAGDASFTLDVNAADSTYSNSHQISSLVTGGYVFTELVPAGWTLVDVSCTGTGVVFDTDEAAGTASFTLSAVDDGIAVVCTFTNEMSATPTATTTTTVTTTPTPTETTTTTTTPTATETGTATATPTTATATPTTATATPTTATATPTTATASPTTPPATTTTQSIVSGETPVTNVTGQQAVGGEAVAGVQAPGAPSAGSGQASGSSPWNTLMIVGALAMVGGGLTYLAVRAKGSR